MPSLWFVIPAHGRAALTRACLRNLRRTCDALKPHGIEASAVVIASDENLDTAHALDFWGIEGPNDFLGRKWNDGYELAAREGVDYVMPMGSDDWLDPALITSAALPINGIRCARRLVMVAEDGQRYMRLHVTYEGGIGMRLIPTSLLAPLHYRPCEDDRRRALDTNTLKRIKNAHGRVIHLDYWDLHDFQLIDWKSAGANLNTWDMCRIHGSGEEHDPWERLAKHYPAESLAEMREVYAL